MADEQDEHPAWCATGVGRCGTHLSEPVNVPATAGPYRVDDDGVVFPRIEVARAQTETGQAAVHLAVFDPVAGRWAAGLMTTTEFRALLERGLELLGEDT